MSWQKGMRRFLPLTHDSRNKRGRGKALRVTAFSILHLSQGSTFPLSVLSVFPFLHLTWNQTIIERRTRGKNIKEERLSTKQRNDEKDRRERDKRKIPPTGWGERDMFYQKFFLSFTLRPFVFSISLSSFDWLAGRLWWITHRRWRRSNKGEQKGKNTSEMEKESHNLTSLSVFSWTLTPTGLCPHSPEIEETQQRHDEASRLSDRVSGKARLTTTGKERKKSEGEMNGNHMRSREIDYAAWHKAGWQASWFLLEGHRRGGGMETNGFRRCNQKREQRYGNYEREKDLRIHHACRLPNDEAKYWDLENKVCENIE